MITHDDLQLTMAQFYPVTGASSTFYVGHEPDEGERTVFGAKQYLTVERSDEPSLDTSLSVFDSPMSMTSNIE